MQIYAQHAARRTRQIVADVTAVALIVGWIVLGFLVYQLIAAFAQLGAQLQEAGSAFKTTMVQLGDTLGSVPLIGSGIRLPFDGASDAGAALESAGQSQQESVLAGALLISVLMVLIPVAVILVLWLRPRLRFVRRAGQAALLMATPGGMDLLALRALTVQDGTALAQISGDPAADWRAGDRFVIAKLAHLQLKDLGIRSPLPKEKVGA
ncbi:MAG: hypothetical protein ACOH1K_06200 [Rhodoglobus sp.]